MTDRERIARALATPGGHLSVGRGGYTLHYDDSRLSGYDCETMKALAIEAGLPVVDSRKVPFEIAARLAVEGPMVAVNRPPHPGPYHAFSEAPLSLVATAYRQAGADVHHIADDPDAQSWFASRPPTPLKPLIESWLAHVLRSLAAEDLTGGGTT